MERSNRGIMRDFLGLRIYKKLQAPELKALNTPLKEWKVAIAELRWLIRRSVTSDPSYDAILGAK
jgi:hypothetical protein